LLTSSSHVDPKRGIALVTQRPAVPGFAKLLTGVGISFLSVAVQAITQIVLVRYLGITAFSGFVYWRNAVALAGGLSSLGLNAATVKVGAQEMQLGHTRSAKDYFRWSATVVLAVGLAAGILAASWLDTAVVQPVVDWYFTVAAVVAIAMLSMIAAQVRVLYSGSAGLALERLLPQVLLLVAILVMMLLGVLATGRVVALFMLGFLLVSILVAFVAVRKRLRTSMAITVDQPSLPRIWRDDLRQGTRFFAISFSGVAGSRVPLLLAGAILPLDDVGQFALLISIAGLISIPTLSLNMVTGPELSAARARRDPDAVSSIINKAHLICAVLVGGAVVVLVLFKTQIEQLLGHPGLFSDLPYYIIVASAGLLAVLNVPAVALQMAGFENQLARIFVPLMIVKVVLGLGLGLWFGLAGFAIAELVAGCIIGLLVQFQFRARLMRQMRREAI
jgi:O-antigen/teichoic acid export membrane protein